MTQKKTKILETERLILRQFTLADLGDLFTFYQEAWLKERLPDAPESDWETEAELLEIRENYNRYGFGLWAAIDKESSSFIGRCGLVAWMIDGREEVEVVCTLAPEFWAQGLAAEAAEAILEYGLEHLHLTRLISLMRPQNQVSPGVALGLGMLPAGELWIGGLNYPYYSINKAEEH